MKNLLSNFGDLALSRDQMKRIKGGGGNCCGMYCTGSSECRDSNCTPPPKENLTCNYCRNNGCQS